MPKFKMVLLGIDYGKAKVGLALSGGKLAHPLKVIGWSSKEKLLDQIKKEVEIYKVEKIVVGISDGKIAKESLDLAKEIEETLELPVQTQDETLTSKDAQKLSIEAGIKRKKRRKMGDAYAATIILQNYLDKVG